MPANSEDFYRWAKDTPLTREELDRRFLDLHFRAQALEALKVAWEEALAIVQDRVLARSEDVIAGLRDNLVAITNLEWLTAGSNSNATLAEDAELVLVILEEDRELFAPGPFAVVSRSSDPDTYAVVKSLDYDRESGQFSLKVLSHFGPAGPFADWQVAAVAGSTLAQLAWLDESKAVRDAAVAARDATLAAQADVADKAADVEAWHADVQALAAGASGASGFDARLDALELTKPNLVDPRAQVFNAGSLLALTWGKSGWGLQMAANGSYPGGSFTQVAGLLVNTPYSVSFRARITSANPPAGGVKVQSDFVKADGTVVGAGVQHTITGADQVFRWENITNADAANWPQAYLRLFGLNNWPAGTVVEVTDIKLEQGATATAWAPPAQAAPDALNSARNFAIAAAVTF